MLVHQGDELMKKLVRTVAAFDLFMGEKAVHFVIYIEQEALQVVAGYLVAEAVVGVGEDGAGGVQKTIDGGGKFGRERIAGLLLEEAEKGRFEADAGFTEHLNVGGEKGDLQVVALLFKGDDGAGQEDNLGIGGDLVFLQVDGKRGTTAAAVENDGTVELVQPVVERGEVVGSCHEGLVESESERITFFHIVFFISPAKVGLFSELGEKLFRL